MSVILLMALAGAHLALAGDGPSLTTELLKACCTTKVGPLREFVDEVLAERPVLDFDAVGEQQPVMLRWLEANPLPGNPSQHQLGSS